MQIIYKITLCLQWCVLWSIYHEEGYKRYEQDQPLLPCAKHLSNHTLLAVIYIMWLQRDSNPQPLSL